LALQMKDKAIEVKWARLAKQAGISVAEMKRIACKLWVEDRLKEPGLSREEKARLRAQIGKPKLGRKNTGRPMAIMHSIFMLRSIGKKVNAALDIAADAWGLSRDRVEMAYKTNKPPSGARRGDALYRLMGLQPPRASDLIDVYRQKNLTEQKIIELIKQQRHRKW
jgi:hypothetical protein